MVDFDSVSGFDWDEGNADKNWIAHKVSQTECEEVFFNVPLMLEDDTAHTQHEPRYYVLRRVNSGRRLFVAFTIRTDKIHVISARDLSRKERTFYEEANP